MVSLKFLKMLLSWVASMRPWVIGLLMLGCSPTLLAGDTLIVNEGLRQQSLAPQIQYLEDTDRSLEYDSANALFNAGNGARFPDNVINLGFSRSSYWFRFGLTNALQKQRTLLVEIDYAILDRVDTYCGEKGSKPIFFQLGDHVQFESRPVAVRNFVIPLDMQPGQTLYCLLRVESTSNIALPITVSDVIPFVEHTRAVDWLLGWFYGLAFGLFIYNLLVFFASRERVYLFYVLHVFGGWGYNSALDGSFAMIWTLLDVQDGSVVFFICLSLASSLSFSLNYLGYNAPDLWPRRIGRYLQALIGLVVAGLAVLPVSVLAQSVVYVGLVVALYIWVLGLLRFREGTIEVWAFILGFGAVVIVAIGALLASLGFDIPLGLATYGMKLAWMFELACLSFGLGLRIRHLKIEQRNHDLEMAESRAESRGKTEFLAKVSHEIRTPMNGILGLAELLGMTQLSGEQGRYVSAIDSAGRAMVDVVNDILDYSKLAAGKMTLNKQIFDLFELVRDCASIFEMSARKKQLDLRVMLRQGTPTRITGDAGRVRQVILNLLSNAMKYTDGGHVFLRLSLTDEISDEQVVIRIAVEDTGIGIGRDDQTKLFQSFSQIPGEVTNRESGTGLGLAISQQLVELMGGHIGVDSLLGHGSSFWFTLPVQLQEGFNSVEKDEIIDVYRPGVTPDPQTTVVSPSPPSRRIEPVGHSLRREPSPPKPVDLSVRVLLAEDNVINQKVILGFLDRLGIIPDLVENGRAALEKVMQATLPYDLIFLDCQMPVMDGYEAARRIRQWESQQQRMQTPIVALSAHHSDFHRQQSELAGMNLHLSKPLNFKTLSDAVTQALGLAG